MPSPACFKITEVPFLTTFDLSVTWTFWCQNLFS